MDIKRIIGEEKRKFYILKFIELYWQQKMSLGKVAKKMGITESHLKYFCNLNSLPRRTANESHRLRSKRGTPGRKLFVQKIIEKTKEANDETTV